MRESQKWVKSGAQHHPQEPKCFVSFYSQGWAFVLKLPFLVISEHPSSLGHTFMFARKGPFLVWLLRSLADFPESPGRCLSGLTGQNCILSSYPNISLSVGIEDHNWLKEIKIHPLASERGLCFLETYGHQTPEQTQDFIGKEEGKKLAYLLKTLFSWTTICCSLKELAHRIMCFKRTILLNVFTMTYMDKFKNALITLKICYKALMKSGRPQRTLDLESESTSLRLSATLSKT